MKSFKERRIKALKYLIKTLSEDQILDKKRRRELKFATKTEALAPAHRKRLIHDLFHKIQSRRNKIAIAHEELDLLTNNTKSHVRVKNKYSYYGINLEKFQCKILENTGFFLSYYNYNLNGKLDINPIEIETENYFNNIDKKYCKYFENEEEAIIFKSNLENKINNSSQKEKINKLEADYESFIENKEKKLKKIISTYNRKIAALKLTKDYKEDLKNIEEEFPAYEQGQKMAAFRNARRELSQFNEDLIFKSFGE